jgi:hypothetical protein
MNVQRTYHAPEHEYKQYWRVFGVGAGYVFAAKPTVGERPA